MTHDFNKPPHVISAEEKTHKKRVPVYILILIGIFFIALLAYMFADRALMCAEKTGGFNLVNYRHSSGVYHEQETEDLHRRI